MVKVIQDVLKTQPGTKQHLKYIPKFYELWKGENKEWWMWFARKIWIPAKVRAIQQFLRTQQLYKINSNPLSDLSDLSDLLKISTKPPKRATHPQEKTRTDQEKNLILPLSDILRLDERTIETILKQLRQLKSKTLQQQLYIGLLQASKQQRKKFLRQSRSEMYV